jgi:hypothetical protein
MLSLAFPGQQDTARLRRFPVTLSEGTVYVTL